MFKIIRSGESSLFLRRLIEKQMSSQTSASFSLGSSAVPLVCDKAFVNGAWIEAKSGKKFNVINPATGEITGCLPDMDSSDAETAVQAAAEAFKLWRHTTAKERSVYLRKWYDILVKNQEDLASLITAEAGKPWAESHGEVSYGNSFIEWFSEEARRTTGEVLASPTVTKEMLLIRQPIGVVGLITPWNFPIAMITRKAGAALAAGCTCVVRPAEDTPLTALAVAKAAEDAGIPKGVFNVVTSDRGHAAEIGKVLCESPLVAGISFTGSTAVGKLLYKQCSSGVKRLALELGGNAPFIVFKSADIEKAVAGAVASKFRNCGQTCVSANRFLVEESIFDCFVEKLSDRMKTLKMGHGMDRSIVLGPLINEPQTEKVDRIVKDAVQKGATVHLGGKPAKALGPRFYEPTLISNVTESMMCYREEIFGPVAVCIKFRDEKEALSIANDTKAGLAGYFYSEDIPQVFRVAKLLEVGMIGINEGIISTAEAAFGGIKESGIGREGSHHGIDEFTYTKYICFGNL